MGEDVSDAFGISMGLAGLFDEYRLLMAHFKLNGFDARVRVEFTNESCLSCVLRVKWNLSRHTLSSVLLENSNIDFFW